MITLEYLCSRLHCPEKIDTEHFSFFPESGGTPASRSCFHPRHGTWYLIFDEPTTGEDYTNLMAIMNFMEQLRMSGKTILMITHYYALARAFADRIVIMKQGRIESENSHARRIHKTTRPLSNDLATEYLRQTWIPRSVILLLLPYLVCS